MKHEDVTDVMFDAAVMSGGGLRNFYLLGGGSPRDFETDLSHAIAAAVKVSKEGLVGDAEH